MKRPTVFWIPKPYDLVNQRPPHLKFRGFPTLMASRFSKGADLIPHYPLLTFNLWPTHNLSPRNIGIQKDPKSWSLKICAGITSLCYNKVTAYIILLQQLFGPHHLLLRIHFPHKKMMFFYIIHYEAHFRHNFYLLLYDSLGIGPYTLMVVAWSAWT